MGLGVAHRELWAAIADLGDMALILPAYLAAATALVLHRRYRQAALWGLALLACAAVTALLKAVVGGFKFTVFGHGVRIASLPSGHSGLALVFYGGLAMLLWYGTRSWPARALAIGLLALETLVAVAVFVLGWHPILDIIAGLALGAACLAGFHARAPYDPPHGREIAAVLLAALALISAMHGIRIDDRSLTGVLAKPAAARAR